MEEKPWRRPGADMTDWFNYGFDEESWRDWGAKKTNRTRERQDIQRHGVQAGGMQSHESFGVQDVDTGYGMPLQQMQAMQGMMGGFGLNMAPEHMMAFMGMTPAMGMPGMMGMPSMMGGGGMFGAQQPSSFNMMGQQALQSKGQQNPDGDTNGFSDETAAPQNGTPHPTTNNAEEESIQRRDAVDPTDPNIDTKSSVPHKEDHQNIPAGPKAPASTLPRNIPTGPKNPPSGPKNPLRRYNDRDGGNGTADTLDYGASLGRDDYEERRSRSPARRTKIEIDHSPRRTPVEDDDKDRGHRSRRGYHGDDRSGGKGGSVEREEDWERDSVSSSSNRRADSRRSGRERSDRRRGAGPEDHDSEEERDRRGKDRSHHRSERRAGHSKSTTESRHEQQESTRSSRTRKRTTEDTDHHSPPRESRRRR